MNTNSNGSTSAEKIRTEAASSKQNLFVIERDFPGAGNLSPEELKGISQNSNSVLKEMGPEISWLHSYVTGDKLYCVYTAPNVEMVQEHAAKGGFPANSINKVCSVIDPNTGN